MITTPIADPVLNKHLDFLGQDELRIFILNDGNLRGALFHATTMVNQMRTNHALGIMETLILGYAYMAAALLTGLMKGRDRIALAIACEGPLKGLNVESDASGMVRGYLHRNPIPIEQEPESLDTSPYFGSGTLSLTKHIEGARRPYTGQVELRYGSVAMDLAHYFLTSEQMPTAFNLSIYFDAEGRVTGAAGLFLQAFPFAKPEARERLSDLVTELPSLGKRFAFGESLDDSILSDFTTFKPELIGRREPRFFCECSRERFGKYLAGLPDAEVRSIRADRAFPLETVCHNCSSHFTFEEAELEALWNR